MKKLLTVMFSVASFFIVSTAMAATCHGYSMTGGTLCFSAGTGPGVSSATMMIYNTTGAGFGTGTDTLPLQVYGTVSSVIVTGPRGFQNETHSFVAQCGQTFSDQLTYSVVINATHKTASIVCTKAAA